MIRITAKHAGFRRCGVAHPKEPVEYPDDRWSEEELEKLRAEPMLVVSVIAPNLPRPNAAETIRLVKVAKDVAALDELAEGEERKSVLEAIEARRKDLGE